MEECIENQKQKIEKLQHEINNLSYENNNLQSQLQTKQLHLSQSAKNLETLHKNHVNQLEKTYLEKMEQNSREIDTLQDNYEKEKKSCQQHISEIVFKIEELKQQYTEQNTFYNNHIIALKECFKKIINLNIPLNQQTSYKQNDYSKQICDLSEECTRKTALIKKLKAQIKQISKKTNNKHTQSNSNNDLNSNHSLFEIKSSVVWATKIAQLETRVFFLFFFFFFCAFNVYSIKHAYLAFVWFCFF